MHLAVTHCLYSCLHSCLSLPPTRPPTGPKSAVVTRLLRIDGGELPSSTVAPSQLCLVRLCLQPQLEIAPLCVDNRAFHVPLACQPLLWFVASPPLITIYLSAHFLTSINTIAPTGAHFPTHYPPPRTQSCGAPAYYLCSKCSTGWYCGRSCQVDNWQIHRQECGKQHQGQQSIIDVMQKPSVGPASQQAAIVAVSSQARVAAPCWTVLAGMCDCLPATFPPFACTSDSRGGGILLAP